MNYTTFFKTSFSTVLVLCLLSPIFSQTPQVVSLREIELNEGFSPYAFQNINKINSEEMADKSMGMYNWLWIGDRGERKGKYLDVMAFEFKAARDYYFPAADAEEYPRIQALQERMNIPDVNLSEWAEGYGTYTDYVQLGYDGLVNQRGGNVVSIRKIDITDENRAGFEKFAIEEYQPWFQKNVPGLSAYIMKGDRGERAGQYILVWAFSNLSVRDKYFPEADSEEASEAWQSATEGAPNFDAEFESFGAKLVGTYTDYIIML